MILFLLILVAGCSRVKTVSQTIYESKGIQVRLVETLDENKQSVPREFEHPWDVEATTLNDLLGSMYYQQKVMFFKGKKKQAFPMPQRAEMLQPLQEAFAKATPNQWVDFFFHHRHRWLIISRELLTDGVLFRKDDKLNCVFRNLAYEDLADPEGTGEPFQGNPTKEPVRATWVLVLSPGQNLVKVEKPGLLGSKNFPNWVQLDLSQKWPAPEPTKEELKAAEKAEKKALEEAGKEALPAGAAVAGQAEIEKRLRFLEELRKEGTISEEAFKKKKKELMDLMKKTEPPKK